ncbi:MAG: glycosyl hydrolase family 10 [Flavobacteriaceae bacterium]|nr:glycosyl hydrolase family 10 [Flavobacteriaceae bacterium]
MRSLLLSSLLSFSIFFTACKEPPQGLKDLSSYPIGTALDLKSTLADTLKLALTLSEFNSITADRKMKMYSVHPEAGQYHWEDADALVEFSQKNQLRLFGHTLVWHSGTPNWVQEKAAKDSLWLRSFLADYISTYVGRYKGKVAAWDVVNEPMETKGGALRETVWKKAMGISYVADAFRWAHQADPEADLFLNDFNLERDTLKLNGFLALVEQLQKEEVPISGIGFQMHYRMDIPDALIYKTLKKAAATGLKIHLSEVDLIFNKHDDNRDGGQQTFNELTAEMAAAQAEKYETLVRVYNSAVPPAQRYGITFWGFNDRDTWIKPFFKLNDWPTLYDENLQPKPAYAGFRKGLMENRPYTAE